MNSMNSTEGIIAGGDRATDTIKCGFINSNIRGFDDWKLKVHYAPTEDYNP